MNLRLQKTVLLAMYALLVSVVVFAQNSEFSLQSYRPASPNSFQFLKYTEMPVSEYTGIPTISIPLHEIQVDGLNIPVNLTYHSGGFRVNQEASWVGLGWDLKFGSIVQEINDEDDYKTGVIRKAPDWNESPSPSTYSQKYSNNAEGTPNWGWNTVEPIVPAKPVYSYRIYSSYPLSIGVPGPYFSCQLLGTTSFFMPINGNKDNQPMATDMVLYENYDSEPDVFSANFLGHSIKFLRMSEGVQITVLTKKGYRVQRVGETFEIKVPSGEVYFFEQHTNVESHSLSIGGVYGSGVAHPLRTSSKVWVLTKIHTKNKREITLNYAVTAPLDNYPNYSEKYAKILNTTSNLLTTYFSIEGHPYLQIEGIAKTFSYSKEKRFSLTSISFPNGNIEFSQNGRTDLIGGTSLSRVTINSLSGQIKYYNFNYSYFDASTVGGNHFVPDNASNYGNTHNLRLKLSSITDNNGVSHLFSYNSTQLPSKNSFAVDYWGFYNGQTSNSSLIPSPSRLSAEQLGTVISLPDNGNNNSARLNYAKACMLTSITYPTGGKVLFEYELNEFDNYILPDYATTTNLVTSGNGIRIHAINYQASNDDVNSKRTVYEYTGGKAILPLKLGRVFSPNSIQFNGGLTGAVNTYQVCEISARGFYSTNSLGSGNFVGYDKVVRREVNGAGVSLGKIESTFSNTPDKVSAAPYGGSSQLNFNLPATKQLSVTSPASYSDIPENGSVTVIDYFDNQDRLVKKTTNTYTTYLSEIFYGARFLGESSIFFKAAQNCGGSPAAYYAILPRTLVGYYPIYDIQTLLTGTTIMASDGIESLTTSVNLGYDYFSQLAFKQTRSSIGEYLEEYYDHAYDYFNQTGDYSLMAANRLTEVTSVSKSKRSPNYSQTTLLSKYSKEYQQSNAGLVVVSKIVSTDNPGPESLPITTTYDNYDDNGNLLDYSSNGVTNSFIWDYQNEYLIAEIINAKNKDVAVTSFESVGKGNFQFVGAPVDNNGSVTGYKAYDLTTGSVSNSQIEADTKYCVTYWTKIGSGSCMVNGLVGDLIVEKNGWELYRVTVPWNTSSVTIEGTALIDELRLFPKDATIKSYTYDPLVGITSICDQNNKIVFYEYDGSKRLHLIRDFDKNILKRICYNFKGQPEECKSTFSTNPWWTATGQTRCLPCPQNSTYSSTVREREEIDLNPDSPTYQTLQWVNEGPGLCISPPDWQTETTYCQQFNAGVNTGNQIKVQTDINPCSASFTQTQTVIIYNSPECPPPSPNCYPETCLAPEYKCVRDVCEKGIWSVIKSVSGGKTDPNWYCTYAFCFSDGTYSDYQVVVTSTISCDITCY